MNQLKVNQQETIVSLWKRGWSARRIARELGFNRETVGKYLLHADAKPATPTAGSGLEKTLGHETTTGDAETKPATLTPGTAASAEGKPATPTAGIITVAPANPNSTADLATDTFTQAMAAARANVSLCECWKPVIVTGLDQGLSATRIHQDLVREHGFAGSYQSVKRFVHKLEQAAPVPFRRMDFAPGEQMQVDFGTGAWIVEPDGRRRRPQIFRAVLCCSRAGYSEATADQKTETFLRCLENAYRHFGGVPVTTAPDNLKAAVLHADWFDPELNPKLASFAAHYGTVIATAQSLNLVARSGGWTAEEHEDQGAPSHRDHFRAGFVSARSRPGAAATAPGIWPVFSRQPSAISSRYLVLREIG